MLTKEQKEEYLKNPNSCPFCNTEDITIGQLDISYNQCYQYNKCNRCEEEWTDIYTLSDVEG